ncbi:MAG: methionyl-tRNA formyltransferase [Synergistaceae bacterium]|nr:methionyl-tRNA formyltransferase [Synergistaceae bacterium]
MKEPTIAFIGSGRFAARCLEIIAARVRPLWVLTAAPRAAGRGLFLQNTAVWELAEKLSLPCCTTEKLSADSERVEWIKENAPDLILVIDFGQMIKEPVLSAAPYGCLNIHPSRLPRYRGSAPIQRALMDGLTATAVTLFRLDEGMDSGPLLAQPELEIDARDDYASLLEKAALLGSETLLRLLCEDGPASWRFTPQPSEGASLAPKIDKAEGRIDWQLPAREIVNRIRGIGKAPGVYCTARGKRLRIHAADAVDVPSGEAGCCAVIDGRPAIICGEGALLLTEVQPEGKRALRAEDWARGLRICGGERLE